METGEGEPGDISKGRGVCFEALNNKLQWEAEIN